MPTLPLNLLTQIFLQLQGKSPLASTEPFRRPLEVVGAHGGLGQLAQQTHQGGDGLLELISAAEIPFRQSLIDLPVQPQRCLIQQCPVLPGAVILQELIRILAGRKVQNTKFQLPLHGQLLHLTDRAVGGPHAGAIRIEIEHNAFAVAHPTKLGDLLIAQGRAEGGHRIGDAGSMQGDHIEITLHHHRPVVATDRVRGLVEPEQMLAFLKQLRLRGIQIFGFTAVEAAATEADHPALPVVDRHHHPMTKPVVEAIATLAWHHQPRRLQQIR